MPTPVETMAEDAKETWVTLMVQATEFPASLFEGAFDLIFNLGKAAGKEEAADQFSTALGMRGDA